VGALSTHPKILMLIEDGDDTVRAQRNDECTARSCRGNPRHRFGRDHCHRRQRLHQLLEPRGNPDIRLYIKGGCREFPRFDHSGKPQKTSLDGIRPGNGDGRKSLQPRRTTKDGRRISVEFTIVLLHDEGRKPVGTVAILREVTKRFEEIRELRRRLTESGDRQISALGNG
jgi:hypothetical protein